MRVTADSVKRRPPRAPLPPRGTKNGQIPTIGAEQLMPKSIYRDWKFCHLQRSSHPSHSAETCSGSATQLRPPPRAAICTPGGQRLNTRGRSGPVPAVEGWQRAAVTKADARLGQTASAVAQVWTAPKRHPQDIDDGPVTPAAAGDPGAGAKRSESFARRRNPFSLDAWRRATRTVCVAAFKARRLGGHQYWQGANRQGALCPQPLRSNIALLSPSRSPAVDSASKFKQKERPG